MSEYPLGKVVVFGILLVIGLWLFTDNIHSAENKKDYEPSRYMKTFVYEGCEYIFLDIDKTYQIVHKANCIYCTNKRK